MVLVVLVLSAMVAGDVLEEEQQGLHPVSRLCVDLATEGQPGRELQDHHDCK